MPTKIRLQRKGKKGQPFYNIVIADGRAPRDGRFIEKIGTYNPLTRPAEIDILFDKALDWLQKGAQPTDTVRAILSYKGVMYKSHLLKGVKKGALTPEMAETKFQNWLTEKEAKIAGVKKDFELKKKESVKKALAVEAGVNEAKAAEIAKKLAQAAEAARAAAEQAAEATVAAQAPAPAPETAPPAEEPKQE
ncbi:MAG TPA: 30S ribosomal protein S16 [Bacteroidales bacterium]|nr:30S ribosomal protein S16 [Bacteroidales bacterium]